MLQFVLSADSSCPNKTRNQRWGLVFFAQLNFASCSPRLLSTSERTAVICLYSVSAVSLPPLLESSQDGPWEWGKPKIVRKKTKIRTMKGRIPTIRKLHHENQDFWVKTRFLRNLGEETESKSTLKIGP